MFSVRASKRGGRIGKLCLEKREISTPRLFPVVCLITGTTPRGGGLWKYILQANSNGLLRRNVPVMSQVLHFLDFIPRKPSSVDRWRKLGVRERYNSEVNPPLSYNAPIFFDSGGFQLLWNDNVDLSIHGLSIRNEDGFQTVLKLQRDFGGSGSNIIATLDYPLPPGLAQLEAEERMTRSIQNAVNTALYLRESSNYKPFLFVAAHGQNRSSIGHYIDTVFKKFKENDLEDYSVGLAVGSLVPLRGAKKHQSIIELLRGLRENIPAHLLNKIPLHTFGITGNLVPVLAYLGIDSFDSSTYVQETRGLTYIDPQTKRSHPILEMEELTCNCLVCCDFRLKFSLRELQDALTSETRPGGQPLPNGRYKSEYYGYIALHNLEMDFQIVEETRQAIEADTLRDYLVKHVEKFPKLQPTLEVIAAEDEDLRSKLTRTVVSMPQQVQLNFSKQVISLKYTPHSFDILLNGYYPPENKRILLVIPCSGGKPYSESRSHRFIKERLFQALSGNISALHKVTLSGLYGPVPDEYESAEPVLGYNFRLEPLDTAQIGLVAERLVTYLNRYSNHYTACVGYATSRAYRVVLEQVAHQVPHFQVLPVKPKSRRFTEFFRRENVSELVEHIVIALNSM